MPEIPVPCIPIVADLLIGIPAQLPGQGAVASYHPGGAIVRGLIPDIMIEAVVCVPHKEDVLRDAHSHREPKCGWLDKERWLLIVGRRLLVNGRRRCRYDGRRPVADIDADIQIDVGGKGVGYGESGDKRQTMQNSFHMTVPSLV